MTLSVSTSLLCPTSLTDLSDVPDTLTASHSRLLFSVTLLQVKHWLPADCSRKAGRTSVCARVCVGAGCGFLVRVCVCVCVLLRGSLHEACWPVGDELHNGHYSNRLSRWSPSVYPSSATAPGALSPSFCLLVCVCVCDCECVCVRVGNPGVS